MTPDPSRPTLTVYRRAGCHLCDEADAWLQAALEDRVLAGDPIPAVRHVDVDGAPGLRERYGALVPVLTIGTAELPLVTSERQLRAFLGRALPRLA